MSRCRLLVAGAGISGLLAAAAGSAAFDEVVIVDPRPGPERGRRASPQAGQLHNVLTRGQRHLEHLLPGYREAFRQAGGVEGSVAVDTHVHEFGGSGEERPLGLSIWSAPLQVIAEVSRSLLADSVTFRIDAALDGLLIDEDGVTGARLDEDGEVKTIRVNAVIDATGYATSADRLLDPFDGARPTLTEVRLDRWFVSVALRRPRRWWGTTDFWMVFTEPPDRNTALLSPFRDDQWVLSVSSQSDRSPPRDLGETLAFLDTLPGPPLRAVLEGAQLLGDASTFRRPFARWRHYERLNCPLTGFWPIGDAFAAVNPVFGQGVGIAAWQATALEEVLSAQDLTRATRDYLTRAGGIVDWAWQLEDVPVPRLSPRDWKNLARRIAADPELQRQYVGLWHLVEPSSILDTLVANDEPAIAAEGVEGEPR